VITAAGTDERVAGLVYIAALAPDAGETSQIQQDNFPTTDVFAHVEVADGRVWMLPDGADSFAGDLPEHEQKLVWATHFAPAADLFLHEVKAPPGSRSRAGTSSPRTTEPSSPSWSASSPSAWVRPPTRSKAATCRCFRIRSSCWM
jgi:hypothetical protein